MTEEIQHPAGWHPDPHDAAMWRWWDGETWTEDRRPRPPQDFAPETKERENGGSTATLGYLFAIIMPFVGFFIGIALIARGNRSGGPVVAVSVIAFFVWLALLTNNSQGMIVLH
jgi:hypothetical protein